jgi:hypothetical protein
VGRTPDAALTTFATARRSNLNTGFAHILEQQVDHPDPDEHDDERNHEGQHLKSWK